MAENDIIIVLGCSLSYREVLRERVEKAVELYKSEVPSMLLLSGGPNNDDGVPESHAMKEMCLGLGVPEENIILEDRSLDTLENARYSEPLVRSVGAARVFLVTSSYHSFRSGIIFRSAMPGVEIILSPCEDHFTDAEFQRRMNSERRQLGELEEMGYDIPAR